MFLCRFAPHRTSSPHNNAVLLLMPLQMLMSLDPSSSVEKPSLRTENQTQTSVGLSVFNVDRLKKMLEDMQVRRGGGGGGV